MVHPDHERPRSSNATNLLPKSNEWTKLREASGRLEAEGEEGFEGLLAALFAAETGSRFFVARKGDQPVGDVYSPVAGVALQAKRYIKATISENGVEGDIDRALREAPALEVFVVAATKSLGQLVTRLAHKANETGLDILALSLCDGLSDFGALCVTQREVIQRFIPDLGADWQKWAGEESQKPGTKSALQRLRGDLLGLTTRRLVSKMARTKCAERFSDKGAGLLTHNRILLTEAVDRPKVAKQLQAWWEDSNIPIAVLEGEEGTGKTWVAASFAESLNHSETSVVFWLDSLFWSRTETLEELLRIAIARLVLADERLRGRIHRKLFHLWQEPVLLILDGANERDAWNAVDRLLQDYAVHRKALCQRIRLLFTTRPKSRPARADFWTGCHVVRVGSFDNEEFKAALKDFAPDLTPQALTKAALELARIPRYFRLCVHLRDQLASVQHLSKELLFWADLRDKLSRGDPQVIALNDSLQGTPEEILAELARKAGWPVDEKPSVVTEELRKSFPNFLKARANLVEQRIVLNADFNTTALSTDHVVLGWALLLRKVAEDHHTETPDRLRERLLRHLEPAASNDSKVRAVHLAAVLSFLDPKGDIESGRHARASLLGLWVSHHNAWVSRESLNLFVQSDLLGYTLTIEMLFREELLGSLETTLVAPLAQIWRDRKDGSKALRQVLERWLRLIYPGGANGSKDRDEQPPTGFIAATTPEQLRLSYAATSVISFRPDLSLLPALLDFHKTPLFCYADRSGGGTVDRSPIKSASEPLGILLRWGYTELIMPELVKMSIGLGPKDKENLHMFARLLRMSQLPREIGPGGDIYDGEPPTSVGQFAEFRKHLQGTQKSNLSFLVFNGCAHLAARRDLASLEDSEVQYLLAEMKRILALNLEDPRYPGSWESREVGGLLPWLARYAPQDFEAACLALWVRGISSKDPVPLLIGLDDFMPGSGGGQLVQAVLEHGQFLVEQPNFAADAAPLTEMMLLHGDLNQLMAWLRLIEDKCLDRGGLPVVAIDPLDETFKAIAPHGLADLARREIERALASSKTNPPGEKAMQIAAHWLLIYSYVAESTKDVAEWMLDLADEIGEHRYLSRPLLSLVCKSHDFGLIRRALVHPIFREFQAGHFAWLWRVRFPPDQQSQLTFDQLISHASFTAIGWLLGDNERPEELRQWGRGLVRAAFEALETEAIEPALPSQIQIQVDEDSGLVNAQLKSLPAGGMIWHDISSPVWGIDRHTRKPSPNQKDYEEAAAQFNAEMKRRRESIRREFVNFNAAGPLSRWSTLEPDAFAEFAIQFLKALDGKNPAIRFEFWFFASCIWSALLHIRPEIACHCYECGTYVIEISGAGLSREIRDLWAAELNTSGGVINLRRRLLDEAPDDERLLWHAVAAHYAGNQRELVRVATEFLAAETARDRALGATLLAFQGDLASEAKLAQCVDSDASFWVREHAKWCFDVCAAEWACKQRYREILSSGSLHELAVGLAELGPALTHMSRSWRSVIEKETHWPNSDRRMVIYLQNFWWRWKRTNSNTENTEVCNHRLRHYCRGERLKEGLTNRQAPWWKLDD